MTRQPQAEVLNTSPHFAILAIYENGGHHITYSHSARQWLDKLAADSNFRIDYIHKADTIDERLLSRYQLFIQLDYPPYGWGEKAMAAFRKFIEEGRMGWIGFHHATLLGEFDGHTMWNWFSEWMGGIRFRDYIASFAAGTVQVERPGHPCMQGLPKRFRIFSEEWYTYDKSPRGNVEVLASVDESTYDPDSPKKMGDHPVVWTNPGIKARNVYIFMGHTPDLISNPWYTRLFQNAIFWAAGK